MEVKPRPRQLDHDGVWAEVFGRRRANTAPGGGLRPALFLDRDGVMVEEVNYLHRPQDVRLIRGAVRVVAAANRRGVPVVLVTNQAGIGRRYYDWDAFSAVQEQLDNELDRAGVHLDGVYACPFHPDGRSPYQHPDHPARKPNPGMLVKAAAGLVLDLSRSWLVGDRAIDVRAARNAGCAGAMHVRTGHGLRRHEREAALVLANDHFRVVTGETIDDALDAVPLISGA